MVPMAFRGTEAFRPYNVYMDTHSAVHRTGSEHTMLAIRSGSCARKPLIPQAARHAGMAPARARPAPCLMWRAEGDAVANNGNVQRSLEILIDELTTDEEFRASFFRSPFQTLRSAGKEWGVPLSETEIHALIASGHRMWDGVADALNLGLLEAA
jgi:hypothetical protein